MARFLLAVTVLSYVITSIALSADEPKKGASAQPAPAKLAPIYVKLIWPYDLATPAIEKDRPVIESWITKSIENRNEANFRAVTAWVPLAEDPFEGNVLWDGKLDGETSACHVVADVFERKDGLIKISFRGWTPYGSEATVTLKDEPGSREVVPVTQVLMKHGLPQVAIFIGVPVE